MSAVLGATLTSATTTNLMIVTADNSVPQVEEAPERCDMRDKKCIVELIEKYSKEYNYPKSTAKAVAYCESEYKANAVGDNGKAYGVYQFHRATFDMFAKQKGEVLDYYDPEDNIKLAIWALANDKEHHWTCYRKIASK